MLLQSFEKLVEATRLEARMSTNSSRGLDNRDYVEQIVKRNYEILWDEYDWQHLFLSKNEADSQVEVQAGLRVYDCPPKIDLNGITKIWCRFGNIWHPLEYGVSFGDYNSQNPDDNQRSDPIIKWRPVTQTQIEVWPLPASNDGALAFEGKRKFVQLVEQADVAEIDSLAIVLTCASEILASQSAKDAPQKASLAIARINKLKARASSQTRIRVGMGDGNNGSHGINEIRVAYAR